MFEQDNLSLKKNEEKKHNFSDAGKFSLSNRESGGDFKPAPNALIGYVPVLSQC